MRTNKRTVWFLTLLSLVAVIAIYSINKNPMQFDGMKIFENAGDKAPVNKETGNGDKQAPVFAESYLFDDLRMEVLNERSQIQDQLTTKINSLETPSEKNEVFDEMAMLIKRNSVEALMETQIKALGYKDAFVRTEGNMVNVTVLSEDGQSAKQANEITYLVMSTWEEARKVKVDFKGES
jgi:stage III sporulation protein AH